eukprot:Nk52_evm23s2133 gene=Nk52_evmTU23s2133
MGRQSRSSASREAEVNTAVTGGEEAIAPGVTGVGKSDKATGKGSKEFSCPVCLKVMKSAAAVDRHLDKCLVASETLDKNSEEGGTEEKETKEQKIEEKEMVKEKPARIPKGRKAAKNSKSAQSSKKSRAEEGKSGDVQGATGTKRKAENVKGKSTKKANANSTAKEISGCSEGAKADALENEKETESEVQSVVDEKSKKKVKISLLHPTVFFVPLHLDCKEEISRLVKENGGKVVNRFSKTVTHVVIDDLIDKSSTAIIKKVKKEPSVDIVNSKWVRLSCSEQKLLKVPNILGEETKSCAEQEKNQSHSPVKAGESVSAPEKGHTPLVMSKKNAVTYSSGKKQRKKKLEQGSNEDSTSKGANTKEVDAAQALADLKSLPCVASSDKTEPEPGQEEGPSTKGHSKKVKKRKVVPKSDAIENEKELGKEAEEAVEEAKPKKQKTSNKSKEKTEATVPASKKKQNTTKTVPEGKKSTKSAAKSEAGASSKAEKAKMKSKFVIKATNLPQEERDMICNIAEHFGAEVADDVSYQVTHVVSGDRKRTLNILKGISHGCWIVSPDWVLSSLEAEKWLPEEKYEMSDWFHAVPIARKERQSRKDCANYIQDLFSGMKFSYGPKTQPKKRELEYLSAQCGAKNVSSTTGCSVVIGYLKDCPSDIPNVSERWLLDSICEHKSQPFQKYILVRKGGGGPVSPEY